MNPESSSGDHSLAELRLLHLADSALPIGALAHSFGLETLVSANLLDTARLPNFLRAYMEEAGLLEAVFCRSAFRLVKGGANEFDASHWLALNHELSVRKLARESRLGSASLGRNFLEAVCAVDDSPILQQALQSSRQSAGLIHHSAAFGLTSGALGLDENRAVLAYLHQSAASLVSACQRLLPLGQRQATSILWDLKPTIIETAHRSAVGTVESAGCFTPLLDWGAMEHPALRTRLFIS